MNASEILLGNVEKYAIMLATTVDLKSNTVSVKILILVRLSKTSVIISAKLK